MAGVSEERACFARKLANRAAAAPPVDAFACIRRKPLSSLTLNHDRQFRRALQSGHGRVRGLGQIPV